MIIIAKYPIYCKHHKTIMSFDQKALTKKFKYSEKIISFKRPRSVSEIHLSVYRTKCLQTKLICLSFLTKQSFWQTKQHILINVWSCNITLIKRVQDVSARCVKIFKNNKYILKSPLSFRMRCISFGKKVFEQMKIKCIHSPCFLLVILQAQNLYRTK